MEFDLGLIKRKRLQSNYKYVCTFYLVEMANWNGYIEKNKNVRFNLN